METEERIAELVEVMKAARLLGDFAKLPAAVMAVQFDSEEKRAAAFACATETVMQNVLAQMEVVANGVVDLAGELAEAKEENAKLMRTVAKLERCAEAALAAHTDPPATGTKNQPRKGTEGTKTNSKSKRAKEGGMPKYVERRGKKFRCSVQKKDMVFRKDGFATAQGAHDYAVARINNDGKEEMASGKDGFATAQESHDHAVARINNGGTALEGKSVAGSSTRRRPGANQALPRFVYERNGKYDVLCNRTGKYFCKTGFTTADAASEWAEAEFARKSAEIATEPPAGSSHANHGDPSRPRTPAEMKVAIDKKRDQTGNVARQWLECGDCSHEYGGLDDPVPDNCPKCGSVKVAKMEGFDGADAVEVRT